MKIRDDIEQLTIIADMLEQIITELKHIQYPLNEYIVKGIYVDLFLKPKN